MDQVREYKTILRNNLSFCYRFACNLQGISDHEEADTRMCIHIQDAMQKGAKKILLRTVDTDVIVILAGNFFFYNQHIQISIFGLLLALERLLGTYYHLNKICLDLGKQKCVALPFYHSFTGCDTTSQFFWQS